MIPIFTLTTASSDTIWTKVANDPCPLSTDEWNLEKAVDYPGSGQEGEGGAHP